MESLLSLPTHHAIWYAVVLLTASYIRGFSGFGFTAVFLTGLAFIMPVVEIVPLSIALELVASSAQARGIFRHVKWRQLSILLATCIVFTPAGVYLLGYFKNEALRDLALVFIFLSSVYLIFLRKHHRRFSDVTYALVGAVIGVINGATALSGLVLALFFSLSDERATQMRATMIAYLFAADIWAFSILVRADYYDSEALTRALVSIPLLAVGVWLGSRRFAGASQEAYRRTALWILLVLSAAGLVASVTAMVN